MAIPSGSGTEVLKRHSVETDTGNWTEINWGLDQTADANTSSSTVPTNHILTILNVNITNYESSDRQFHIRWGRSGATVVRLVSNQNLSQDQTFIYSDKIVLYPGDIFSLYATGNNVHFYINYIDQERT